MGRQHSLVLTLGLLLSVMILLAMVIVVSSAQTSQLVPCQEVTSASVVYTPTVVYPGEVITVTAEILSGSPPVTYTWDVGDGSDPMLESAASSMFSTTYSYTTTGQFSITLTAWNSCTLTPLTVTALITVEAQPCITVTKLELSNLPAQVHAYEPVYFTGEIITGSLPVSYTWDFGDETPLVSGLASQPIFSATHAFTQAQSYTVALTAWNACTVTPVQEASTVTVVPCDAVTAASFSYWPQSVQSGEVVTFSAVVTGGSPPLIFDWALGDGMTNTGQTITHVYSAAPVPITYTVSLTAWNPCGTIVEKTILSVSPWYYHTILPVVERSVHPPDPGAHLGYGANVASADHATYLAEMGFDWAKGFVTWDARPPYDWVAVDNQLREFLPNVPNVLLRVGGTWGQRPPLTDSERAAFRAYVQALAKYVSDTWRYRGLKAVAYEIWNEPNLDYEWGGTPNAAQYTALLKGAYLGVRAGDPNAWVVSAGLATTGGSLTDSPSEQARILAQARSLYGVIEVVPDLTFLRQMYENGAKGYFDAMGTHPYGGVSAPDTAPGEAGGPIYFRRAEEQHQVMLAYNDPSPMWNTEFGWVLETSCNLGEHEWMEVSEAQQAQYLAAAYAYADENWPWMGPMFLFNLDFATVTWYCTPELLCDPMRWYSITYRQDACDPGNSPILPRQAFYSLSAMPKNSGW